MWAEQFRRGSEVVEYSCGHCGREVASEHGTVTAHMASGVSPGMIRICPSCNRPSYLSTEGEQFPGPLPGKSVEELPGEVEHVYMEARRAMAASAYTASVLTARKLLMHVAVDKGAETGKPFVHYVEFLKNAGYVPPNGDGWIDYIRRRANEENHEIVAATPEDAGGLLVLAESLLRNIYELPARVPSVRMPTDDSQAI